MTADVASFVACKLLPNISLSPVVLRLFFDLCEGETVTESSFVLVIIAFSLFRVVVWQRISAAGFDELVSQFRFCIRPQLEEVFAMFLLL